MICKLNNVILKQIFLKPLYPSFLSKSFSLKYENDPVDINESKFEKVLIANRGEIACRVIKSCKRMGIKTVAIYSEADNRALHVKMADESYNVGASPSTESYLNMEHIMEVIKNSNSDAVHPGYGFLSENMEFCKLLKENNVTFIGPNDKAIRSMGDKLESKKIAKNAGVNIVPGFDGVVNNIDECIKLAKEIGYPVMIKASAGGGGKGMRIAWNDHEVAEGFKLSSQEAASSFGDDRLLVEKFIYNPRHIEIQVLCDKYGNRIHLNERECSIQRRNQKVIEESPSSIVNPELREKMGQQALSLCKEVGYDSAGTVEFLVDADKNFYFLEMNTRLQVEHPITEFVTGIDIVHQMIRIAKGHKLKLKQNDIKINGWSFESRVYAEDPRKNFGLPSIGRLTRYIEPTNIPNVRCDSGITEGSEISIYYDPLICKLVTHGNTRNEARNTMKKALDNYVINGVTDNISLLRDIMTEKEFIDGNINTSYLPQTYPDGFSGKKLNLNESKNLYAICAGIYARDFLRSKNYVNGTQSLSKNEKSVEINLDLLVGLEDEKERLPVKLSHVDDKFNIDVDENHIEIPYNIPLSKSIFHLNIHGKNTAVQLLSISPNGTIKIRYYGTIFKVHVILKNHEEYYEMMPDIPKIDVSKVVQSPMPGIVKSIIVNVGEMVSEGQEVCIIEAMKMQNSLSFSNSGKVKSINFESGDSVEEDQILMELE